MTSFISTTTWLTLAVTMALCVAVVGCNQRKIQTHSGPYRTVAAQPLRDTDRARTLHKQGLKHLEKGELDEAAKDLQRALEADVEYGPAHNSLGRVYFQQGRYYEAAWEFEYARKALPREPEPLNNLGLVQERDAQYDQAIDYYRQAAALDQNNINYPANLARALIRRGDRTDEVRVLLQRILDEDTRPEWLVWAKGWATRLGPPD